MTEGVSNEILRELKKINEKLDKFDKPKSQSISIKIIALFIGFMVIGPLVMVMLSMLMEHL